MVDSTEELSALMQSTKLSQHSPVDMKSGKEGEVLLCLPRDNNPAVWDALPPKEFVQKHGGIPLNHEDLEHILVLVKDQNGNYTPSVLLDKTVTKPDGTALPYKDRVRTAQDKLREWGVPANLNPERVQHGTWNKDGKELPKYKLEGERQFFETPGGLRSQQNEYKNIMTTGASAPDMLLHNGNKGILVFRHENDGLGSIDAVKQHYGYEKAQLKSTGNFYHDAGYIDARSKDWNTADHRFKGYLNEGHTKDLGDVMVSVGGGRMFDAKLVLEHLPDTPQAQKLRYGPTPENEHILINVKDPHNNTHVPIELASVTFPGHLSKVADRTGIHKGDWAETKINASGSKELTPNAINKLFQKHRDVPDVMVQSNGALYPLNDPKVTAKGADFIKEYPRDKTFVATVGDNGGRNGSYRNAASLTNDRMPPAALEALRERTAEPRTASRFATQNTSADAAGKETAPPAAAYATPAATPAVPSRFANSNVPPVPGPNFHTGANVQTHQFENMTPQSYQASQAARDGIISRPSSRDSHMSVAE
ncbi:hypothetical protein [Rhizobium sp. BT-226]|uniref:VirE2 family protein n=1 Tax=Rhizobium sp. BT-226 TaxID=2986922 RepID=UPI0021F74926|nr:hypothetical protein [Rhizobium sp. BT-226]MCW0021365.1 hypothetical protein [Rhizobium sp. BT-226]